MSERQSRFSAFGRWARDNWSYGAKAGLIAVAVACPFIHVGYHVAQGKDERLLFTGVVVSGKYESGFFEDTYRFAVDTVQGRKVFESGSTRAARELELLVSQGDVVSVEARPCYRSSNFDFVLPTDVFVHSRRRMD